MLSEMIKKLREDAGFSQSQLAKKLDVTRSSVNAWEMGLSTPTTPYIVELSNLFHVSTDYILELDRKRSLSLDGYSDEQIELLYKLINYFDKQK